jgi:hypothetical protein
MRIPILRARAGAGPSFWGFSGSAAARNFEKEKEKKKKKGSEFERARLHLLSPVTRTLCCVDRRNQPAAWGAGDER